jgi:hypothetical protein
VAKTPATGGEINRPRVEITIGQRWRLPSAYAAVGVRVSWALEFRRLDEDFLAEDD